MLASLLGLSGVGSRVREIIQGIQEWVHEAINKMIDKVVGLFTGGGDKEAEGESAEGDAAAPDAAAAEGGENPDAQSDAAVATHGTFDSSGTFTYSAPSEGALNTMPVQFAGEYQLGVADQAALDVQFKRGEGEEARYDNAAVRSMVGTQVAAGMRQAIASSGNGIPDVLVATNHRQYEAATTQRVDPNLAPVGLSLRDVSIHTLDTSEDVRKAMDVAAGQRILEGDISKYGEGQAPAGWEARKQLSVPSGQVVSDDPGHTYHLLDDGTVVATSVESLVTDEGIKREMVEQLEERSDRGGSEAKEGAEELASTADPEVALAEAIRTNAPLADGATTPTAIKSVLSALPPILADNQELAPMMIGKLERAMSAAREAWAEADAAAVGQPRTAAAKQEAFIDSRLRILRTSAPRVIKREIQAATLAAKMNVKDTFWNIIAQNYDIVAPEEEASSETLNEIGGVYKAFDAGQFFDKMMDKPLKDLWIAAGGGRDAWIASVRDGQSLPTVPPGMEANPDAMPYANGTKVAYSGTVSGFVSTAKAMDDPQVVGADKATVLRLLALEPGRYPSPKMFLLRMGAAGANSQRAATAGAARPARVGKPSMFYLIAFPDNVYVAENRDHGLTAGNEPELQALDMPVAGFLGEHPMVKS